MSEFIPGGVVPVVRVYTKAGSVPAGKCIAGGGEPIIDSLGGGFFQATVRSLVPIEKVSVSVVPDASFDEGYIYHCLGMRIDLTKRPATWAAPSVYPGPLQGAVAAAYSKPLDTSYLLAPAPDASLEGKRKHAVRVDHPAMTIDWLKHTTTDHDFVALKPYGFRFWYGCDNGAGGARGQVARLARAYRTRYPLNFPNLGVKGHGIWAFQGQNSEEPTADFLDYCRWMRPNLPSMGLWGVKALYGGSCCTPEPGVAIRYAELLDMARILKIKVYKYARPDHGDGVVDANFWNQWRQINADGCYGDTVGYRDINPQLVPSEVLTEGASLAYPACPALVANCMTGGAFAVPGGPPGAILPCTLPDGTPEPRSTEPWFTSAPWFGTILNHGRDLLSGDHNADGYFDGEYHTTDGRSWTDALWTEAFLLGHKLAPRNRKPVVDRILGGRNNIHWSYENEYLDKEGIAGVSDGVDCRRFQTKEGRTLIAFVKTGNAATLGHGIDVDGRRVALPAFPMGIVELPG